MQSFEIILKNERSRLYDRLALFIFILNAVGICLVFYLNYSSISQKDTGQITALALFIFLSVLWGSSRNYIKKYLFVFASVSTGLYWLLMGFWWIGLILLLLSLFYTLSKKDYKVKVNSDNISYPSFPKRLINWNELNNAVLKDGLLTIDFKNNRIIQHYIDTRRKMIDQKEFNEFCTQQLKASRTK
jgi:predicted membrane protein